MSLSYCDALLAGVNDEQCTRELVHLLDTAQELLQLLDLEFQLYNFLLGQTVKGAVLFHLAQLSQTVNSAADGLEVGEHTAQPSSVYIVSAGSLSLFLDAVASLLLGADKQNILTVCRQLTNEHVSLVQLLNGLLQVDDVDAVSLGEDVLSHLGVPATGLVTEVHTSLEQLLHRYYAH